MALPGLLRSGSIGASQLSLKMAACREHCSSQDMRHKGMSDYRKSDPGRDTRCSWANAFSATVATCSLSRSCESKKIPPLPYCSSILNGKRLSHPHHSVLVRLSQSHFHPIQAVRPPAYRQNLDGFTWPAWGQEIWCQSSNWQMASLRSSKQILTKRGENMEPCGIPEKMNLSSSPPTMTRTCPKEGRKPLQDASHPRVGPEGNSGGQYWEPWNIKDQKDGS